MPQQIYQITGSSGYVGLAGMFGPVPQGVFTVVVAGGPGIGDVAHGFTAAAMGTAVAATGGGVLVVVGVLVAAAIFPATAFPVPTPRFPPISTPEPACGPLARMVPKTHIARM